jgi:hypothetical protein
MAHAQGAILPAFIDVAGYYYFLIFVRKFLLKGAS